MVPPRALPVLGADVVDPLVHGHPGRVGCEHEASLEPERGRPARDRAPQGQLAVRLDLPGNRGHLAVEPDLVATVGAGVVAGREQLLPAAGVRREEGMRFGALARRRAGRSEAPRRMEQHVHAGRTVDQRVHLGAAFGQHGQRQVVARDRDGAPAADMVLEDHPSGIVSRMYQFAVSPQSTVRLIPVIPDASSDARKANAGRDLRRLHEPAHRDPVEVAVQVLHQLRPDRRLGHLRVGEARATRSSSGSRAARARAPSSGSGRAGPPSTRCTPRRARRRRRRRSRRCGGSRRRPRPASRAPPPATSGTARSGSSRRRRASGRGRCRGTAYRHRCRRC